MSDGIFTTLEVFPRHNTVSLSLHYFYGKCSIECSVLYSLDTPCYFHRIKSSSFPLYSKYNFHYDNLFPTTATLWKRSLHFCSTKPLIEQCTETVSCIINKTFDHGLQIIQTKLSSPSQGRNTYFKSLLLWWSYPIIRKTLTVNTEEKFGARN